MLCAAYRCLRVILAFCSGCDRVGSNTSRADVVYLSVMQVVFGVCASALRVVRCACRRSLNVLSLFFCVASRYGWCVVRALIIKVTMCGRRSSLRRRRRCLLLIFCVLRTFADMSDSENNNILRLLSVLAQKLDSVEQKIDSVLDSVEQKIDSVKSDLSQKIDNLTEKQKETNDLLGHLYEHNARGQLEKQHGIDWCRSFTVTDISGLCRLVHIDKTKDRSQLGETNRNVKAVINFLSSHWNTLAVEVQRRAQIKSGVTGESIASTAPTATVAASKAVASSSSGSNSSGNSVVIDDDNDNESDDESVSADPNKVWY
jgi:hypothetical protein